LVAALKFCRKCGAFRKRGNTVVKIPVRPQWAMDQSASALGLPPPPAASHCEPLHEVRLLN